MEYIEVIMFTVLGVVAVAIAIFTFEGIYRHFREKVKVVPKEGKITERIEQSQRSWTEYRTLMAGVRACVVISVKMVDDADHILVIEDKEGRTARVFVSEETWKATEIGIWYKVKKGDSYTDIHEETVTVH